MLVVFMRVAAVPVLATLVTGGYWAYAATNRASNYNEVTARVERISVVCRPVGARVRISISCEVLVGSNSEMNFIRETSIYVRYKSPADGNEYSGSITLGTGPDSVEALNLHAGSQ
jgi:hypothetical protein